MCLYMNKVITSFSFFLISLVAMADEPIRVENTAYMSVEDSLRNMDKNLDGIVTVYEVRSYIESVHGKNYKKDVLDNMESSASGKSCSTPFAKSLYQ